MIPPKNLLFFIMLCFIPCVALAETSYGAGAVADNLMQPVVLLGNFIGSGSIAIGISSLFAAFIKYMQYRVNPLQSPISTVVLLLVMGLILVLLPLSYKLTTGGVPLSL